MSQQAIFLILLKHLTRKESGEFEKILQTETMPNSNTFKGKIKNILRTLCRRISPVCRRKKPLPESPERIAVLACNWIGDTFWTLQSVQILQKRYPDAEIFVCVKPASAFIFRGILDKQHILITENLISDKQRETFRLKEWLKELRALRMCRCDLLLDFMSNRYSAFFARLTGIPCLLGLDLPDNEFIGFYTLCKNIPANGNPHLAMRPQYLLSLLTGDVLPPEPQLPRPHEKPTRSADVVIVPGAGWMSKCYPAKKYRKVVQFLTAHNLSVCITGSPKEADLCRFIADNQPGAFALNESMETALQVLANAKVCIGNDTGTGHLAAAMCIHTITIFCGTNPDYCRPLGKSAEILRSTCPDIPCGTTEFCHAHANRECNSPCFMNIPPETVADSVLNFIFREKI